MDDKKLATAFIVWAVICLTAFGGALYVAAHFIKKWW